MTKILTWLIELSAGLLGGLVFAFLGGWLGSVFNGSQGLASLAGVIGGMLLAFPLGVGSGMGFAAFRLRRHKRPYWAIVGAAGGILLIVLLAEPTGLNRNATLLVSAAIISC